jgi:hypothetical protein
MIRGKGSLVLVLLALAAASPVRAQGVRVAVTPATQSRNTGTPFGAELTVMASGASFNGFTVVLEFDTALITYVPSPPQILEGTLMTGACAERYLQFSQAADSIVIADVLLCSGQFVSGPGQLFTLGFSTANHPGVAGIRIRRAEFYRGGSYVSPVRTTGAVVNIGSTPVPETRARGLGPSIEGAPNPFRSCIALNVEMPAAGRGSIDVCDLSGRTVRHLGAGSFPEGSVSLTWDGRDDRGELLPAALYFARLRTGGTTAQTRITLLR